MAKVQKAETKPSDEELVKLLNESCKQSFKVLFDRYIEAVTKYAHRICNNQDIAQDVAQDVFAKVWDKRKTLKSGKSFKFFLFILAKNIIISNFRRLNNHKKYKEYFQHAGLKSDESLEQHIDANELSGILNEAIDMLPDRRKAVFQLCRNERLTYKEIGERLNISPRTVEVHISLALKNIREHLRLQYGNWVTMLLLLLWGI